MAPPKGRQPRAVAVIPSPKELPKMKPDAVAQRFPKPVKVPAPPKLKDQLQEMERLLTGKTWKQKSKGRRLLNKIVKAHKRDMVLARYLVTRDSPAVITKSIPMLRGLKRNDDFIPVVVSLLGHSSDQVRAEAVSLLTYGLQVDSVRKALPYVRALLDDKSCSVRRKALAVLLGNNRRARVEIAEQVKKMRKDPCPAVSALATRNLGAVMAPGDVKEPMVKELLKEATSSPFFLNRCAAMTALGTLVKAPKRYDEKGRLVASSQKDAKGTAGAKGAKGSPLPKTLIREVTKALASGLTLAATPSLTVYYQGGKIPYTFSNHSSMPACAADALAAQHHESPKGKTVERVARWRKRMAGRGWSKRPPKNLCTGRRECEKGKEICFKMECAPIEKVVPVYWEYLKKKRCIKNPSQNPKWRNFGDDLRIEMGFGLHWMARYDIRKYLRKKDNKAFSKKYSEIRSQGCEGKKVGGDGKASKSEKKGKTRNTTP